MVSSSRLGFGTCLNISSENNTKHISPQWQPQTSFIYEVLPTWNASAASAPGNCDYYFVASCLPSCYINVKSVTSLSYILSRCSLLHIAMRMLRISIIDDTSSEEHAARAQTIWEIICNLVFQMMRIMGRSRGDLRLVGEHYSTSLFGDMLQRSCSL